MAKDFEDMPDDTGIDDDKQTVAPVVAKDVEQEPDVDYDVKFDMTAFAPEPKAEVTDEVKSVTVCFEYIRGNGYGPDDVFEVELPITVSAFTTENGKDKCSTYTIIRRLRFDRKKLYAEALANAQHVTVVESINESTRMRRLAGLE
jgi:hypothetical protein